MKAVSDTFAETYKRQGAWSDLTLDQLFKKTAEAAPDRLAIADAPDKAEWTGGEPRQVTYGEADREIERLAGFFRTVGLAADHVIGLQAPNTVDMVIAFLAALRADLVVTPLPLHWRQKNVVAALNSIGAKGFVAADRVETRMVGNDARDVAAELFSLRFVFGLGKEVPDGLIELGTMLAEIGDDLILPASDRPSASDHVATISWTRSGAESQPMTRCHNHWTAAGEALLREMELDDAPRFLVPYALSGLTGLGTGVLPWLMTGGSLHLHHPTSLKRLADHATAVKADVVLAPGPLVAVLDQAIAHEKTMIAAWNVASPRATNYTPRHRMVDVHVADEFALVAHRRPETGTPVNFPPGKQFGSAGRESGPALVEVNVTKGEEGQSAQLSFEGPMVPGLKWHQGAGLDDVAGVAAKNVGEGVLETTLKPDWDGETLQSFGIPGQLAPGIGDLTAIDDVYSSYPDIAEAAAFVVEDGVMGARLYAAVVPTPGRVPDAKAFFAFLDAQGVDLAAIPNRVLVLQSLPRQADGRVDRERLTLRTQRLPSKVA
ncbi:acyl--CoA ligase [Roseibium sp. CAU 1637]|uniref:Acyl--CoA ligase n=1 Tax=Roseibium limicola TaxID=2816037 RepID=A0A939J5T9_9HYPH|nr:class I adenylate-forming enzyme family protein [Roseibium limicola]MBO0344422.1 acyl--CoA ligase [Roseibium limicola]